MLLRGISYLSSMKTLSSSFYRRCCIQTVIIHNLRCTSSTTILFAKNQDTKHNKDSSQVTGFQPTRLIQKLNFFSRKRRNFHSEDRIPSGYELVYVAPMENYIFWSQMILIALSSVIVITLVANLLDAEGYELDRSPIEVDFTLSNNIQLICALGCFLVFTGATRIVIRRYILRMYYNEEKNEFLATFLSLNPKKVKQIRFTGGEVTEITKPDPFNIPALRGQFYLHGKRITLIERYFRYPKHYNLMLGHEKPEDYKS